MAKRLARKDGTAPPSVSDEEDSHLYPAQDPDTETTPESNVDPR